MLFLYWGSGGSGVNWYSIAAAIAAGVYMGGINSNDCIFTASCSAVLY
jgi:hypothetical protein